MARYKERAPSSGEYPLSDWRATPFTISDERRVASAPPRENSASVAMANFSSTVNGTNGRTAVTRERSDGWCDDKYLNIFDTLDDGLRIDNTHPETFGNSRSQNLHKSQVFITSHDGVRVGQSFLIIEDEIMAYIGRP